jgi:hypothetical protein
MIRRTFVRCMAATPAAFFGMAAGTGRVGPDPWPVEFRETQIALGERSAEYMRAVA